MATVNLSDKLMTEIIANATQPFTVRKQEILKHISNDEELFYATLVDLTSQQQVDMARHLHNLNNGWFKSYNSPHIALVYHNAAFVLPSEDKPCVSNGQWNSSMTLALDDANPCKTLALFKTRYMDDYELLLKDEVELKAALTRLFDAVPNLNRALEAMPNLLKWVPDYAQERLKKTNDRQVRTKLTPEEIHRLAMTDDAIAAATRSTIMK